MNTEAILAEREKTHGAFKTHAEISQRLKWIMYHEGGWEKLSHCQREALEMIQHKVARILNGNPEHADHWADIAGYAQLAARNCGG